MCRIFATIYIFQTLTNIITLTNAFVILAHILITQPMIYSVDDFVTAFPLKFTITTLSNINLICRSIKNHKFTPEHILISMQQKDLKLVFAFVLVWALSQPSFLSDFVRMLRTHLQFLLFAKTKTTIAHA